MYKILFTKQIVSLKFRSKTHFVSHICLRARGGLGVPWVAQGEPRGVPGGSRGGPGDAPMTRLTKPEHAPEGSEDAPRRRRGSSEHAPMMHEEAPSMPRRCAGMPRGCPGDAQRSPDDAPKKSRGCTDDAPRSPRGCPEEAPSVRPEDAFATRRLANEEAAKMLRGSPGDVYWPPPWRYYKVHVRPNQF